MHIHCACLFLKVLAMRLVPDDPRLEGTFRQLNFIDASPDGGLELLILLKHALSRLRELYPADRVVERLEGNASLMHGDRQSAATESELMLLEFYELARKKKLGAGNFGTVYRCNRRTDTTSFACKVIDVGDVSSIDLIAVHSEIAILREIQHPNIVALKEVFYGKALVFLILELCEGPSLREYRDKKWNRRLQEEETAHLMRQVLLSLQYLHQRSIAHRSDVGLIV